MDLRSGLDDFVPADGILGLADSASAGWLDAPNGTDLVLHSTGAERLNAAWSGMFFAANSPLLG
jgi:hypothetical protein